MINWRSVQLIFLLLFLLLHSLVPKVSSNMVPSRLSTSSERPNSISLPRLPLQEDQSTVRWKDTRKSALAMVKLFNVHMDHLRGEVTFCRVNWVEWKVPVEPIHRPNVVMLKMFHRVALSFLKAGRLDSRCRKKYPESSSKGTLELLSWPLSWPLISAGKLAHVWLGRKRGKSVNLSRVTFVASSLPTGETIFTNLSRTFSWKLFLWHKM